eukprot:4857387-Pleurochrysis_carterae.AAC.1
MPLSSPCCAPSACVMDLSADSLPLAVEELTGENGGFRAVVSHIHALAHVAQACAAAQCKQDRGCSVSERYESRKLLHVILALKHPRLLIVVACPQSLPGFTGESISFCRFHETGQVSEPVQRRASLLAASPVEERDSEQIAQ